jgi:hypothetical protein
LTLYLRNSQRLKNVDHSRARVVEGDVLDINVVNSATEAAMQVLENELQTVHHVMPELGHQSERRAVRSASISAEEVEAEYYAVLLSMCTDTLKKNCSAHAWNSRALLKMRSAARDEVILLSSLGSFCSGLYDQILCLSKCSSSLAI